MKNQYIAEQWKSFHHNVLHDFDPNSIPVTEMRKAFFAGAIALFKVVMKNLSEGKEATEEDLKMMSDIHEELKDFKDEIHVLAEQERRPGAIGRA